MARVRRRIVGRRRVLNWLGAGLALGAGYAAFKGAPKAWNAVQQFEWRKAFKRFISGKKPILEKFSKIEFHNPPLVPAIVEIQRVPNYRLRLNQIRSIPENKRFESQKQWIQAIASRFSRVYGIDPKLVMAIIQVESSYRPQTFSEREVTKKVKVNGKWVEVKTEVPNAFGLMQIVRTTDQAIQQKGLRKIVPTANQGTKTNPGGKRIPLRDLFDPLYNLDGGIAYLGYLRTQAKKAGVENSQDQLKLAVMAYNQGFEGIQNNAWVAMEAENYLSKVVDEYEKLKELNVNELERETLRP